MILLESFHLIMSKDWNNEFINPICFIVYCFFFSVRSSCFCWKHLFKTELLPLENVFLSFSLLNEIYASPPFPD